MLPTEIVVVGKIKNVHGLKGLVKAGSYTDPPENLSNYSDCYLSTNDGLDWRPYEISTNAVNGSNFLLQVKNVTNRDSALLIKGALIGVERERLESTLSGEFYWADLIGCTVKNHDGFRFGAVDRLFETGSSDIMVILGEKGDILVPFSDKYVFTVDLDQKLITVDWEQDWV